MPTKQSNAALPKKKKSTTAIGDELRDHVIELLDADGYKVDREVRIGTKKIDVLLTIDDEFSPQVIAVECKNEERNLTQGDVNRIYADHLNLINGGQLSAVWIISKLDFSPEAKSFSRSNYGVDIFPIKEFEEKLLGFRRYCREVSDLFSEGQLDEYYVQATVETGDKLDDLVLAWLEGDDSQPVAILGGYGMGKTSYCKYLTSKLADGYLKDPLNRIPIYVRLSDIATQTDIDGLIAKTLTDRYSTKNYSFAKFKKLNRIGKFLLIFDGFDEMKHALTWSDFKYNFSQINSLLEGKARLIVAGRPNAFMSDDEHAWVLRGTQLRNEQEIRIPGIPKYTEHQLREFSDVDVETFLNKYLSARVPLGLSGTPKGEAWVAERIGDFDKLRANGDLYRPVHLKIYADIAADPDVVLQSFTTYELYNVAATRVSEREGEKVVRKRIDPETRQAITERIAWWLWDEFSGRKLSFVPDHVPESVIGRELVSNPEYERNGIYREIFSGSFLERKYGENYYFSHRSFLEFFVARYMESAARRELKISSIFKNINPEVLAFLRQSPSFPDFLSYIYASIQKFSGDIPTIMLEELHQFCHRKGGYLDSQIAIQVLFKYYSYLRVERIEDASYIQNLKSDLKSNSQDYREASLYFCLLVMRDREFSDTEKVVSEFLSLFSTSIRWTAFKGSLVGAVIPRYSYSRQNIGEYVFLKYTRVAAEMNKEGRPILIFDYAAAFAEVHDKRRPKVVPSGVGENAPLRSQIRVDFDDVFRGVSASDQRSALEVLRRGIA
ncbi:NACHT domain-containing protein [Agrobacterium rhizogenes]|uniref:NACHT domain-containing protein n=1 Tax=Rhizobium rhizogenes TaxID=359 RepID=UPI0015718FE9|nr:NACHT domain-containing protein [Rhizobium rhizogenes]NTF87641.1 NACHT domain-containing protein [Rhizobium rhizogenes]